MTRRALSIGSWIVLASMVAALPILLFSLVGIYSRAAQHQADSFEQLTRRAQATSALMLQQVEGIRSVLRAVTISPAAERGDEAELYEHARRLMQAHPEAEHINLSLPGGAQAFSTLRPRGEPLAPSMVARYELPVFQQAVGVVTPLYKSSITGRWVVGIAEPISVAGKPRYALRMNLSAARLSDMLKRQRYPDDWTVALVDQNQVIVARSRDAERFVGTEATDSLRAAIRARAAGPVRALTKDGTEVFVQVAPVGDTGWYVGVGVPAAKLRATWLTPLLWQLTVGLVCLVAAVLVGRHVGRLVSAQLTRSVSGTAGEAGVLSPIAEVNTVIASARDQARREEHLRERLEIASTDAITGLLSRSRMEQEATRLLAAAEAFHENVALLYVDLDGFKKINDTYGHAAGDQVLADVGALIREVLRPTDLAARWGGDEFVICVRLQNDPAEAMAAAVAVAERLLSQTKALENGLGCSIGIAASSRIGYSLADLVAAADEAMLAAKRAGKHRVLLAGPRMRQLAN